jgi:hypothetical protein
MKFRVYGEYGPIASMCITEYIEAETSQKARAIFIDKWKKHSSTWARMGEHNVYADRYPSEEKE